jgi:hypothetical protein
MVKPASRRRRLTKWQRLRRQLKSEARQLGLTEAEYLSMLLHLSKAIRNNLPSVGKTEVRTVAKWVEHPMFPLLVQWLFRTAENVFHADQDVAEPESETESEPKQPQAVTHDPHLPNRHPGWL